jgi:hypothetical protein
MSNLDHPISILIAAGGKITLRHRTSAEEMFDDVSELNAINRAISILHDEKRKDEMKKKYEFMLGKNIKL